MTDLFSYLLPHPASVLRPSYCNSSVWLIQEDHPSLSNRGSINSISPSVGCSPRLSYGSTATVISTELGKEELKFDANTFLLELNFESIQMTYFGHKSFKASVRPKFFNYIISYPTTNPTHPP
jgi:hypothetical protein